jgi:hypothetical protein
MNDLTFDQEQIELSFQENLTSSLADVADFAAPKNLPDLSLEQLDKAAIPLLRYLLQLGEKGGYKDPITSIVSEDDEPPSAENSYLFDFDKNEYRGKFIDRRPSGDRVFRFLLRETPQGWYREIQPISGVDDDEDDYREWTSDDRQSLADGKQKGEFAGKNQRYPIGNREDVKNAWNLAGQSKDESPDMIRRRVIAIAKRYGWTGALPKAAIEWAGERNISV